MSVDYKSFAAYGVPLKNLDKFGNDPDELDKAIQKLKMKNISYCEWGKLSYSGKGGYLLTTSYESTENLTRLETGNEALSKKEIVKALEKLELESDGEIGWYLGMLVW